jgi:hypothetical protein
MMMLEARQGDGFTGALAATASTSATNGINARKACVTGQLSFHVLLELYSSVCATDQAQHVSTSSQAMATRLQLPQSST